MDYTGGLPLDHPTPPADVWRPSETDPDLVFVPNFDESSSGRASSLGYQDQDLIELFHNQRQSSVNPWGSSGMGLDPRESILNDNNSLMGHKAASPEHDETVSDLDYILPGQLYSYGLKVSAASIINTWKRTIKLDTKARPKTAPKLAFDPEPQEDGSCTVFMCLWANKEDKTWTGYLLSGTDPDKWYKRASKVGLDTNIYKSLFVPAIMTSSHSDKCIRILHFPPEMASSAYITFQDVKGNYDHLQTNLKILLLPICLPFDPNGGLKTGLPLAFNIGVNDEKHGSRYHRSFVGAASYRMLCRQSKKAQERLHREIVFTLRPIGEKFGHARDRTDLMMKRVEEIPKGKMIVGALITKDNWMFK